MVEWRAYMVTATTYIITVGDGGQGAWGPSPNNPYFGGPGGAGYPGGNSTLQFLNQYSGSPYTLTAYGGGGGGGNYSPNPGTYSPDQVPGGAGGAGGGGGTGGAGPNGTTGGAGDSQTNPPNR